VVDERGRLVGVAVAKVANTNIGFAVPAAELTRMLDGRVGRLRLGLTSVTAGGEVVLSARVGVIDPLNRLRSVELLVRADESPPRADRDGNWQEMDSAQRVTLNLHGGVAEGSVRTRLTRPGSRNLLIQASAQDATGLKVAMKPETYVVPLRPTSLAVVGNDRNAVTSRPEGTPGALVDPSKTCKLSRNGNAITIDVPAGVYLPGTEFGSRPAPMALTGVEGDFALQVSVTGTFTPGTQPARFKGHALPNTYQGAGLVLYVDRRNYIRIERAAAADSGRPTVSSEIVVEVCDKGKISGPFYHPLPDGPLYLRIERVRGGINCMFGPNGIVWIALQQLAVRFPDKLKVGLIATNASKEALSARFEGFALHGAH
jgi:regulation of enolase protein 1 (concanavalin A-like superfamily)